MVTLTVTMAVLQGVLVVSYFVICRARPASSDVGARVATTAAAVARTIDVVVIDSVVNGVGLVVRGWSVMLRRVQSGAVRLHILAAIAGIVSMLGYFLWR